MGQRSYALLQAETNEKLWTQLTSLYNILCIVNTQHTSKQDAVITVMLYWLHVSAVNGHLQAS